MAMSRAESPWMLSAHADSDALDRMTWKTGDLFAASIVSGFWGLSSPSCGEPTAKAVQLRITLGCADWNKCCNVAVLSGSLSEATKIGSGLRPRRVRLRTKRLIGFRPPPWTRAR